MMPFRVSGVQQIAHCGEDREIISWLWVDIMGSEKVKFLRAGCKMWIKMFENWRWTSYY
jgi:hypothetical protein